MLSMKRREIRERKNRRSQKYDSIFPKMDDCVLTTQECQTNVAARNYPKLCPIKWVRTEVQGALDFGERAGWLARAKAIKRLRDHNVEIYDELFPWPDRKYLHNTNVLFSWGVS